MMGTRQAGFTLVELLIVTVLTGIVLAGVYQTLIVQEKTYEVAGLKIHDQESLRTGLGILESELREVAAIGGTDIGGSDIAEASPDSVVFRAQRKTGFICKLSRSDKWILVWTVGDLFESEDPLLLFVDGDSIQWDDDRWDQTVVDPVTSSNDAACAAYWPDAELQHLKLPDTQDMTGVQPGSPVRSYEWITYGLYDFGSLGWGLGRRQGDRPPVYLVGGLAGPGQGVQIDYFTPAGSATTDPTAVSRVRITIRTDPKTNTGVQSTSMTANLFLRNN